MHMLAFLLLPVQSLSALIDNIEKDIKTSNVYISSQYKPSISHFRNFSIQKINSKTNNSVEPEKNTETTNNTFKLNSYTTIPHNIQFQNNTISFSGIIGYSSKGLRLEAEGSYEEFYIKNSNDSLTINSNKSHVIGSQSFTVTQNNRLSITSIMVNTCYDIAVGNSSVVPYLCTGIGGDVIGLFYTTYLKFAYQGKVGISYLINNNILLFSDIYYHKVTGNEFRNLYIQHVTNINNFQKITPVLANLDIGYFGSEIGVRFIFNK
ncbi:P44/Msp2 family outer membrane protein [Ehrlichia sp. JZT12]